MGEKGLEAETPPWCGVRLAHSYFSAIGEGAQSEGWRWEGRSQAQDKGMLSLPTGPQRHLYYPHHAWGRNFWVTGSPSRQHCFRLCSHLLPLALKQYLGLLPNSELQATLVVYGPEWVLREA